jgi:hypothetical protein
MKCLAVTYELINDMKRYIIPNVNIIWDETFYIIEKYEEFMNEINNKLYKEEKLPITEEGLNKLEYIIMNLIYKYDNMKLIIKNDYEIKLYKEYLTILKNDEFLKYQELGRL